MLNIPHVLAEELSLQPSQVSNALQLLAEGGTVPFIARYRKERTGEMNETQLRDLFDRYAYITELEERKRVILKSIEEQGKMTEELRSSIERCLHKNALEDLYLPFKPKKRTRATIAREKGLEPLATLLKERNDPAAGVFDCEREAMAYVSGDLGVASPEEALAGASDILAEEVAEKAVLRAFLRDYFVTEGVIASAIVKDLPPGTTKYEMYRDYTVRVKEIQPHNMLALCRGEKAGVLTFDIAVDGAFVQSYLESQEIRTSFPELRAFYRSMLSDAYERLMRPGIVSEVRLMKKEFSDHESIKTFESNLRELLLASPAGMKPTLGIDPGFRTGCKIVAIDRTGKFLEYQAVFPHQSQAQRAKAAVTLADMIARHGIELIAIGNGTAGRETDRFVADVVASLERKPVRVMISESGASVYSASRVAISEFPQLDVTVRGAISIGRRLQDPLAELVKIDPKSIGVGQYQHDVDQRLLRKKLEETVESCVNYVGVDVNTASQELLRYVAGVNALTAKNIVLYRNEHGPFASREDLHSVPKFGPKTFEQAAGFLRIRDGSNPLDNSAVHPESYPIVGRIVEDVGVRLNDLVTVAERLKDIDLKRYITETVGEPTLRDLVTELQKPGRDPRAQFVTPSFREGVNEITDLSPGMTLEGVVTNVTNFGAFVDCGVHQDGLVHVSQMADHFVKDPTAVVKVGQIVTVRVLEVNAPLKRISLTMKSAVVKKQKAKRFTVDDLKAKFNSR